jgi:phenylpropionate dioxygenase-like ring-hydroxylating dioxygenase large terminal subunit
MNDRRRGWVSDAWWVIDDASEVRARPRGLTRFGERLVLFRDERGVVCALPARCPHRGADLSRGRVIDGTIACPYHGFRFDRGGRCVETPCEGARAIPPHLRARPLVVREAFGLVWLWRGDPSNVPEIPWFDALPRDTARSASAQMTWRSSLARTLEAMLDIHHLPIAHRSVGAGVTGTRLDPYEARVEDGVIRTAGVLRRDDGPRASTEGTRIAIDVRFPSQVHLVLSPSTPAFVACTPIDETHTWILTRYWVEVPVIGQVLAWLALRFELGLVQPDDQRLAEDAEPSTPSLETMCAVRADAGIVLWHRLADAAEKAAPLRSPQSRTTPRP